MAVSLVELFAHGNYAIHRILDTVPWRYKADTGNRCPMAREAGPYFIVFVGIFVNDVTDRTQHTKEMLGHRSDKNYVGGDHLL